LDKSKEAKDRKEIKIKHFTIFTILKGETACNFRAHPSFGCKPGKK